LRERRLIIYGWYLKIKEKPKWGNCHLRMFVWAESQLTHLFGTTVASEPSILAPVLRWPGCG
jgi:hypothetical protein